MHTIVIFAAVIVAVTICFFALFGRFMGKWNDRI
jgi:hypothetical protein